MLRLEEVDLGGKSLGGCEHDSYKGVKTGFFSIAPKKLKDEKTQNSRKKLKTQTKNSRIRQILVLFTVKNERK